MLVIFEDNGKQYRVDNTDRLLLVDKLSDKKVGDKIIFDKVLLFDDKVGLPHLNASVECIVRDFVKSDKVVIFKKRRRKDSHKKQGHRQEYMQLSVSSITLEKTVVFSSDANKASKKKETKKVSKKEEKKIVGEIKDKENKIASASPAMKKTNE